MNGKPEHPVRIVIDSKGRTPPDAKILHKGPGLRIIAVSDMASEGDVTALKQHAKVIHAGEEFVDLPILLEKLHELGINRLMVEGGGTLIWGLLSAGLVDELLVFVGNIIIGKRCTNSGRRHRVYI